MADKKKIFGVVIAFALLSSFVAGLSFVKTTTADPYQRLNLPSISINEDGSITPETQFISRTGTVYTLTSEIIQQYSITIKASNIVFDGAGYTVNVSKSAPSSGPISAYVDCGIYLQEVTNVTLRNVKVFANNINTVNLQFCSNCCIIGVTTGRCINILGDSNQITECQTGISVFEGSNNLITRNNITYVFVGSTYCLSNQFYLNNFYLTDGPEVHSESIWDNGSVGNFWTGWVGCYSGQDRDGDGVCDRPYVIASDNVDRYPLKNPVIVTLTLPSPTPSNSNSSFYQSIPTAIGIAGITLVVAAVSLIYFKRHRKQSG